MVRNGHLPQRKILTGLGEVEVPVPKVRSRSGSLEQFRSSVVPPHVRRCASLDAAIPWLYLHGVSTGQMRQAVAPLVGEQAAQCRVQELAGEQPAGIGEHDEGDAELAALGHVHRQPIGQLERVAVHRFRP